MKTFHDNADRTWTVAINVDALKRVRSLCDVDLVDALQDGGTLLEKLTTDPVLLCDVIFAVCKEEADAKGVSDVDFGKGMAGDPIEEATAALLEELVGFFPRGRREVFGRLMEKKRLYEAKALELANTKLDDPELDARVEKAMTDALAGLPLAAESSAKTSGDLSTAAPASSG